MNATKVAEVVKEPVTSWLRRASHGDRAATDKIVAWAYHELELLASQRMRHRLGRGDLTLEPAALVNETFLRVLRNPVDFQNRRHFFAFVSTVMLRVLIDYQRARSARPANTPALRVTLSALAAANTPVPIDLIAFEQALTRLGEVEPRKADVVRLRVLWGLSMEEIAATLEVSEPTVRRDWRFARTWLAEELQL